MSKSLKISRWGNSSALRLPAALLEQIGVGIDDELEVELVGDALVLKPQKRRARRKNQYTLSELLKGHNPHEPVPDEIAGFMNMKPVGLERLAKNEERYS
jgi:antitoxin ChpS